MCDGGDVGSSVDVSSSTPDFSSGLDSAGSGLSGFDSSGYTGLSGIDPIHAVDSVNSLFPSMGNGFNDFYGGQFSNPFGFDQGLYTNFDQSNVPYSDIGNNEGGFSLNTLPSSEGYGINGIGNNNISSNAPGLIDRVSGGINNTLGNLGMAIEKNPLAAFSLLMNLGRNISAQRQMSDLQNRRNSAISGQQNVLGPLQQNAANIVNSGAPLSSSQKSVIDSAIDQQEQVITGQIQQQAVNRGIGVDSLMVQQQINYAKSQLEQQRQSQYQSQQQQNMAQALSQLGMSTNSIASTINQMRDIPAVSNSSDISALLSQLSKGK